MKFLLILFLFLIPFNVYPQISELEYYKKMDSLNKEMIYYQFKNDSLKNNLIANLENQNKIKTKQIKRNKFKNLILGLSLTIAIIVISIIQ